MTTKDALKSVLSSTSTMLGMYLADLSDADLQVQPVKGANNIAWQIGHLISSEVHLGRVFPGAAYPELPPALKPLSSGKSSLEHADGGKLTKAQYLEWFNKVRSATIAAVDRLSDADFDKPNTNEVAGFAPTIGAFCILLANHTMMHAGQFTVTRRLLQKPVLF